MITAEQQGGRGISGLGRCRDDCLLDVLAAIRATKKRHGSGFAQ